MVHEASLLVLSLWCFVRRFYMHKHLFLKIWEFFFYDFTENIFCAFDLELFSSFFGHSAQMGSFRGLPQSPLLSSSSLSH